MKRAAIILAAGKGERARTPLPKQFVKLGEKEIIDYSIEKFSSFVERIVVVVNRDYMSYMEEKLSSLPGRISLIVGGETRQLSVWNGLSVLKDGGIDYVAIHDSARPFFSTNLLERLFSEVMVKNAVIPVLRISSTLAKVISGEVVDYIPRDEIFFVQTPQVFRFDMIFEAHRYFYNKGVTDFTDDSQIVKAFGGLVYTVGGEEANLKITTPFDLEFARFLLNSFNKPFKGGLNERS